VLENQKCVNTGISTSSPSKDLLMSQDYKPANILLSGIEPGRVVAKVGDLGLGEQALIGERYTPLLTLIVFPTGHRFEAQPYSMRAPEVFLGQACTEPSQVWAVAAMLLC
jgi:hypothetical protein